MKFVAPFSDSKSRAILRTMMSVQKLREIMWVPLAEPVEVPLPLVSGSGLIYSDGDLWVVGDDLHQLIQIRLHEEMAVGHRIFPGDLPADFKARKKLKPDTEAFFALPSATRQWVVMPSGSKPNRVKGALIRQDLEVSPIDFTSLYQVLHTQIADLNIEGAAILNDQLVLLQRGNGKGRTNALIKLRLTDFVAGLGRGWDLKPAQIQIEELGLGTWDQVPLTFTDGLAHDGKLYFSAAAEDTESTFEDGEVLGSMIGVWDGRSTHELGRVEKLKIEGLALEKADQNGLSFFAVTDADETMEPSLLLKLEIST